MTTRYAADQMYDMTSDDMAELIQLCSEAASKYSCALAGALLERESPLTPGANAPSGVSSYPGALIPASACSSEILTYSSKITGVNDFYFLGESVSSGLCSSSTSLLACLDAIDSELAKAINAYLPPDFPDPETS